jgi:hypothetical protein
MQLCKRIAEVIKAMSATPPPGMGDGLQFAVGPTHVAMKAEHWQEAWGEQADTGYIQGLYKNAAPPSNFGWDDVGAGGSGVQSEETNLLNESLSYPYPPNTSVDYWTIPDSY